MSGKISIGNLMLEKRAVPSPVMVFIIPLMSVFCALVFGAVFLYITGQDALKVYGTMFSGAFGSYYGLSETIVKAIPIALCGLGISIAFRMQLWNIGAEGQLYMGAFAASWVPLTFTDMPALAALPLMMLLGAVAGGLWSYLPAISRAYLGVNEIITTLMLNYVAILWVDYLVYGPWKDPNGYNFPLSAPFPDWAMLPTLGQSRVHAGFIFALVAAVLIYILLFHSKWGFEIRVIGQSETAARYAGMNIRRNILLVMFMSGALCGLAGMAEVSGIIGRMQYALSPGYGFTAIIVAWLSKLNPFAILVVSVLFGGLQVGGYLVQTIGVPANVAAMLQGSILFFVLGGEILNKYRIVSVKRKGVTM
jgi:simple sugar transport system permease protein